MGEPTDVMRAKFKALNAQDGATMTSFYSPSVVKRVPGGVLHGPEQILAWVAAFWEAFPDLQVTVVSEVEQASVVAIRATITGTHRGVLRTPEGDLPPTGRNISLTFADDYELQDGLVVSSNLHLDRLALLEQLGAVPAAASA
jgi:predicted ester cyclase